MIGKQTSFEQEISIDQSSSQHYEKYIENLKANNQMIAFALKTAERLIEEYQRENIDLKAKNRKLGQQLSDKQEQIEYLKGLILDQQHQLGLETKIQQLLARNSESQEKIIDLTQQLEKCNKRILKITKQKQGGVQKSLNHYFKFSKNIHENTIDQSESLLKEIRSLKWKIEQRDDQINMLLRRNKDLEQLAYQYVGSQTKRQQKFVTCSTQPSKGKNNRDY